MPRSSQILTVAQMQAAEQSLVDGGQTISSLMERAGAGAAQWVWRMAAGRSVTVLCGPGNNGGDGYVIARVLEQRGLRVSVIAPQEPRTQAAMVARSAWGGQVVSESRGGVFVDCLFGSGLTRALDAPMERLLQQLVAAHDYAIAVDLPSGVDADSCELLNPDCPRFDLTLALGAWKFAHWLMPALQRMGHRRLVDIGIAEVPDAARLSQRPRLSAPDGGAHKYTRGLVAVVGGQMPGAALLAARVAMHGGAGYVKLLADRDPGHVPAELVVEQGLLEQSLADQRLNAVLIGPGLGRDEAARVRLAATLAHNLPTVCDADALHLLQPDMLDGRSAPLILTPHAGELAALGKAFGTVGLDRLDALCELAETIKGVVVAKGPDTMLAAPGMPLVVMSGASSWLSTAGTGDVLAGLIASRLAGGRASALDAAQEGCHLHTQAARLAGPAFTAAQLINHISVSWRSFL